MTSLAQIARTLSDALGALSFAPPVHTIYDPLTYAWERHVDYLERFGKPPRDVLMMGMNPGPWGMAQTGVPFGSVPLVRDWLKLGGEVGTPDDEHPKRPIMGVDCHRVEVSGDRFWGWARDRFSTPEAFFERFFVWNYCPLMFMAETGRNVTPDKLKKAEREALHAPCDAAVRQVVEHLDVSLAIGIGAYAEARLRKALDGVDVRIGRILHPSPASPIANKGWQPAAEAQLRELGVELPGE